MRAFAKLEALAPGAQRERSWYKSCARAMRFLAEAPSFTTRWPSGHPCIHCSPSRLILKAGRVIRLGGRDRVDLARSALRGFHDGVQ